MTLIYIIFTIVCIFLVITVLLQPGKSGGLGAAFGGGGNTVFGASGGTPVFRRMTTGAAVCFMLLSLLIAYLSLDTTVTGDEGVKKRGLDFSDTPTESQELPAGLAIPAPTPAAEIPVPTQAPAPAAEVPAPVPAAEVPAPVPAAEVPAPVPAAEVPAPAPAAEVPAPVPAAEAPAPAPAAEVPAPAPAAEAPAADPTAEREALVESIKADLIKQGFDPETAEKAARDAVK